MPISQVGNEFSERLHELKSQAAAIATASGSQTNRPWQLPAAVASLRLDAVAAGFPRTGLNTAYLQAIQSATSGVVSDCIATKLQLDTVATMERALSLQLASPCRLQAFATARRAGHGQGELFDVMEREVANYMATGGAAP